MLINLQSGHANGTNLGLGLSKNRSKYAKHHNKLAKWSRKWHDFGTRVGTSMHICVTFGAQLVLHAHLFTAFGVLLRANLLLLACCYTLIGWSMLVQVLEHTYWHNNWRRFTRASLARACTTMLRPTHLELQLLLVQIHTHSK